VYIRDISGWLSQLILFVTTFNNSDVYNYTNWRISPHFLNRKLENESLLYFICPAVPFNVYNWCLYYMTLSLYTYKRYINTLSLFKTIINNMHNVILLWRDTDEKWCLIYGAMCGRTRERCAKTVNNSSGWNNLIKQSELRNKSRKS